MVDIQLLGAGSFGALIGWYVYYINRHRREEVSAADLVSLIGVIGGVAVLKLFPEGTQLFGAYGIGLAVGFFSYFLVMLLAIWRSKNFTSDYLLDGRRKRPATDEYIPTRAEQAAGVGAGLAVPTQSGNEKMPS
jgi:hypothetical protein